MYTRRNGIEIKNFPIRVGVINIDYPNKIKYHPNYSEAFLFLALMVWSKDLKIYFISIINKEIISKLSPKMIRRLYPKLLQKLVEPRFLQPLL